MKYFSLIISSVLLISDVINGSSNETSSSGCASSDSSYDNSVPVTKDVSFYWTLVGSPTVLKGSLRYNGIGWLGFGISGTPDGGMKGSDAIIGLPDYAFEGLPSVLKYDLDSKSIDGVVPMEEEMQTLTDMSISQDEEKGTTELSFKKLIKEDGEIEILKSGQNTFIWAVGASNTLGHHKDRGSFVLDLSNCEDSTTEDGQVNEAEVEELGMVAQGDSSGDAYNKKAFIAHGILAAFAWSVCSPFAIATAWFRRLVPTGWIYMHVLANVSCFFITLVAFIIAVVATSTHPDTSHFSKGHHVVGLIIMIFVTLQVMNGFMRPPVEKVNVYRAEEEGLIPRSPRAIWHVLHKCTGVTLLLLSVYQVKSGLTLFSELFGTTSILPLYWTTVIIFVVSVLVIKLSMVCDLRSKDGTDGSKIFATLDEVEFSNPHDDISSLEISNKAAGSGAVM